MFKVGAASVEPERGGALMQLAHYLGLLHRRRGRARGGLPGGRPRRTRDEVDVRTLCADARRRLPTATRSAEPFIERYGEEAEDEPERLHSELFQGPREGAARRCCATSRTST